MEYTEFTQIIKDHYGEIEPRINWVWAHFPDNHEGRECFSKLKDHCEHRGYYEYGTDEVHAGGFRFRYVR